MRLLQGFVLPLFGDCRSSEIVSMLKAGSISKIGVSFSVDS